jgi:hypothetical protein
MGCNLKPFEAIQRVRPPPGRGVARQPEASLAWVAATSLVKRRQRMLKPCVVSPGCNSATNLTRHTSFATSSSSSRELITYRPGTNPTALHALPVNQRQLSALARTLTKPKNFINFWRLPSRTLFCSLSRPSSTVCTELLERLLAEF